MQRPRRTSEFHDDPGGVRRQTRTQTRTTLAPSPNCGAGGGGTAVKFANRQSRIAVRTRSSSLDKAQGGSNNAFLSVNPTVQRGFTPQKTPLSEKNVNRVLFTAEKFRSASKNPGKGPLHNDKKWISEQSQRITEYLLHFPAIGGISSEFLKRGLRQMSIKQFVAIINFFLGFIWAKRFVVGNNHVDDIMQILQKLHYPHPVNKSWLKTPNTQHSFGNVIVLFDYFMDFVPHSEDKENPYPALDFFELQEPLEVNTSRAADDMYPIPDLEFQYEMLRNSEEGFMLWDTQMVEDFKNLQKKTCELLIQKLCNFPNADAIEKEVEQLRITLKALESETPVQDPRLVKVKADKAKKLHDVRIEITHFSEICRENARDLKRLHKKTNELTATVDELGQQINQLQETIAKQLCSVEQRDQLITEKNQIEQMLKIEGNTVRNLEDRNYQKQVLYSRVLRRFTEQVGLFNEIMREITFSEVPECRQLALENLQLPLRPDDEQLQKLIPVLNNTKDVIERSIKENKTKITELGNHIKQIVNEVDTKLETQVNSLRASNTTAALHFETFCQYASEEHTNLNVKIQELLSAMGTATQRIEQLQQTIAKKTTEVEVMREQNEATMQQAEEKHERCLAQRRAYLETYCNILENSTSQILPALRKQVQQQQNQLEEFKKEF